MTTTRVTTIRVGDSPMEVFLGEPARAARAPAIVLMYHRGGVDAFTKSVVERLAGAGYLAAVPDVYHRAPPAMPLMERKNLLKDSEIVADVAAVVAQLQTRSDVAPDRIIIMGHCMGGRMALLAAGSLPQFCGAVIYYGGSVARSWGDGPTRSSGCATSPARSSDSSGIRTRIPRPPT